MIAYLRGTLQSKEITGGPTDRLVVDVGGIGFEVIVSKRTLIQAGEIGDSVTLPASLSIRENDWTLFGFNSSEEKEMFGLLQSVSGVGPKLALALVGTLGPGEIADAILNDDQKMLSHAPGVGAKVAQRIILELKSKMEGWTLKAAPGELPGRSASKEEAREILGGLGYTPTEITMALKNVDDTAIEDVEELVRQSLRVLGAAAR